MWCKHFPSCNRVGACVCVCAHACVCVCGRERYIYKQTGRQTDRVREADVYLYLSGSVCLRQRKRETEKVRKRRLVCHLTQSAVGYWLVLFRKDCLPIVTYARFYSDIWHSYFGYQPTISSFHFIADIYIAPLQVGLLRSAPNPNAAE